MKLSDVTVEIAAGFCGIDEMTDTDRQLLETVVMPAAKARVESYTGQPAADLNDKEEVTIAYLALVSFFWDNRSMSIEKANERANPVLADLLDAYRVNLLPTAEGSA